MSSIQANPLFSIEEALPNDLRKIVAFYATGTGTLDGRYVEKVDTESAYELFEDIKNLTDICQALKIKSRKMCALALRLGAYLNAKLACNLSYISQPVEQISLFSGISKSIIAHMYIVQGDSRITALIFSNVEDNLKQICEQLSNSDIDKINEEDPTTAKLLKEFKS